VSRPRLLDLFCCEGGAAWGYHLAGFDVVGVDLDARFAKRYPFTFHAGDAVEHVRRHGREFDAVHASPPCQHASAGTRYRDRSGYPRLIEPVREALQALDVPWVVENVAGSALHDPMLLCGSMFDLTAVDDDGTLLRLERHRLFESNVLLMGPAAAHRHDRSVPVAGSYGGARRDRHEARHVRHGGYVPSLPVQQRLLGIDWMTQHGMHQALPPAYTRHVGSQLMTHLSADTLQPAGSWL
jgi:DNA (cytosine-5)-methyltransferase 1